MILGVCLLGICVLLLLLMMRLLLEATISWRVRRTDSRVRLLQRLHRPLLQWDPEGWLRRGELLTIGMRKIRGCFKVRRLVCDMLGVNRLG